MGWGGGRKGGREVSHGEMERQVVKDRKLGKKGSKYRK